MECWADAGPQRLLSTHAANVSSRAEATAGQLEAIENTQRSRCIFRAEPFHLPGAYFCGLSREEVINRIGSVSVETATILTELFRPVRRPPSDSHSLMTNACSSCLLFIAAADVPRLATLLCYRPPCPVHRLRIVFRCSLARGRVHHCGCDTEAR